jgi:hypothetical protein
MTKRRILYLFHTRGNIFGDAQSDALIVFAYINQSCRETFLHYRLLAGCMKLLAKGRGIPFRVTSTPLKPLAGSLPCDHMV